MRRGCQVVEDAALDLPGVDQQDYGLTTLQGVGVFVIGLGTLLIGIVLMLAWNARSREFFRGETFTQEWAEAHAPDLIRD